MQLAHLIIDCKRGRAGCKLINSCGLVEVALTESISASATTRTTTNKISFKSISRTFK